MTVAVLDECQAIFRVAIIDKDKSRAGNGFWALLQRDESECHWAQIFRYWRDYVTCLAMNDTHPIVASIHKIAPGKLLRIRDRKCFETLVTMVAKKRVSKDLDEETLVLFEGIDIVEDASPSEISNVHIEKMFELMDYVQSQAMGLSRSQTAMSFVRQSLIQRFERLVVGKTWQQYPDLKIRALQRIYSYVEIQHEFESVSGLAWPRSESWKVLIARIEAPCKLTPFLGFGFALDRADMMDQSKAGEPNGKDNERGDLQEKGGNNQNTEDTLGIEIFLQSINLSLEDNGNRNDLGQDSSPRSMTPISPTPSIQISSRRKPIDEDFQEKLEEYEKDLAIKLKNYGANKDSNFPHSPREIDFAAESSPVKSTGYLNNSLSRNGSLLSNDFDYLSSDLAAFPIEKPDPNDVNKKMNSLMAKATQGITDRLPL